MIPMRARSILLTEYAECRKRNVIMAAQRLRQLGWKVASANWKRYYWWGKSKCADEETR